VSGCDCEISSLISSSLAAEREGKRLQVGEEIGATFIGMESRLTWQEIDGIEEGGGVTARRGHARGFHWRKKILTTLAHLSARREREREVPIREEVRMGRGLFLYRAGTVSPRPFLFFFFFSSFSFSVFYFFHNYFI
jgi:hypothetical protein